METLRGIIPNVLNETVEFIKTCPPKWKCDKCSVIAPSFWRSSSAIATNVYGSHLNGSAINGSNSSLTSCTHKFCGQCLESIFIGVQTAGKCPLDNVTIHKKQMIESVTGVNNILSQEVYCSNKSRGCRKRTVLSELEVHHFAWIFTELLFHYFYASKVHLKSCPYSLVHCPLKCGQGVTIKSLPVHMDVECPRRVISCEHCEEDIVLEAKIEHENNCPKKPVVCNYCKNKSLLKYQLRDHLDKCELKPRNCRLVPLGCKFSVNKNMNRSIGLTRSHPGHSIGSEQARVRLDDSCGHFSQAHSTNGNHHTGKPSNR